MRSLHFYIPLSLLIFAQTSFAEISPRLEPSIGSGTSTLSMNLSAHPEDIAYTATNLNFTFVNLKVNGFSLQGKFPIKDPESSRLARGDSKIMDYQMGYSFSRQWHSEFYFQKYQSYYISMKRNGAELGIIQPDLSFEHHGGQLTYVVNPDYSFTMVRDTSWEQTSTASSFFYSVGVDYFGLKGDLVPEQMEVNLKSSLEEVKVASASARANYGKNWIWDRWYAGLAGGIGVGLNQTDYRYTDKGGQSLSSAILSNFGLSLGYRWGQTKVGVFGRAYQWKIAFDDKQLESNTSNSGVFVSSVF